MRTGSFYDDLSDMSCLIYQGIKKNYKNFKYIESYSDKTGVYLEFFEYKGEGVIVICGTHDLKDLHNDLQMVLNFLPEQVDVVNLYYLKKKKDYNIILTGHSLGGSIAQIIGNLNNAEAVTFEAYGTGDIISKKHDSKIRNYGNKFDPIFISNFNQHVGKIFLMPIKANEKSMKRHMPNNYGKPSQAKECRENISTNKYNDFIKPSMLDGKKLIKQAIPKYTEKAAQILGKSLK